MHPARQIGLGLAPAEAATLGNFQAVGEAMGRALDLAIAAAGRDPLYLWGVPGCGKSHLLQALVHRERDAGRQALYLPLAQLARESTPALLDDLGHCTLLALDDIESVHGRHDWQRALLHLYNRGPGVLAVASDQPPAQVALELADLRSRLQRCLILRLPELDEAGKKHLIGLRASRRGMTISEPMLRYLLHREARDMHRLFDCLDQLDRATLSRKRRLTILFIKEVMNW